MQTLQTGARRAVAPSLPQAREAGKVLSRVASAPPVRRVDEADEVSALIGDVYDAALDPARWPAALDRAARFVGGGAAAIYSKCVTGRSGEFCHDNGCIDAHYRRLYRDQYARLDPTTTGHVFAEIDVPMATHDLVPYSEFVETRFYQEWARPQEMAFGVSTVIDKAAESTAFLGIFRNERDGVFDNAAWQRMRRVAPHIRRAVVVGRTIEVERSDAAAFADTLDGISAGLFLLDATGNLLHANVAGRQLIANAEVLRFLGGRLVANDARANALLATAFAAAGDTPPSGKGLDLSLTARCGDAYVGHVLPLTGAGRFCAEATATWAFFVHKAELTTRSPSGIIAKTFKLTPTELRVLLAIVEVGGAPEVAETLGVAESTVKTHLGRLYGKTGTGRQADLVKLVAGYSSPLFS